MYVLQRVVHSVVTVSWRRVSNATVDLPMFVKMNVVMPGAGQQIPVLPKLVHLKLESCAGTVFYTQFEGRKQKDYDC